jgi:hypothetical protein
MSLRRSTPLAFHPRTLSDALDSSMVGAGAMAQLRNLIPDPSTKLLWQCRPAAQQLTNFTSGTGGPFSGGFSTGFAFSGSIFPQPVGVISCMVLVGPFVYGMIATGTSLVQDYPFCYNLNTNAFIAVSGAVTGTGGTANLPIAQPASGAWTPPIMDVVGAKVLVAHPGFSGVNGNWFGWIDISNALSPVWHAGDLTGTAGITFASLATPPVAVANFFNRAYWLVNPKTLTSAVQGGSVIYSAVLNPTVANTPVNTSTSGGFPVITFDDTTPLTALGKLPLNNQLGGVIQALIVFKGISNMYQITGDDALNSLARNALTIATGTFAPLSICSTPKGLAFVAPDGVRLIDFDARVSEPIGIDGTGKTMPFILAFTPSRISAAANGVVYRVSVDDGSQINTPLVEYWLDFSREGIWSGPHNFPSRVIKPYQNTFISAPWSVANGGNGADATLWQSDYVQTSLSSYVENSAQLLWGWTTSMLPDTDQMAENAMIETTLYLGMAAGATYNIQAIDQNAAPIAAATVSNPGAASYWGTTTTPPPGVPPAMTWGQAVWGGVSAVLYPKRVPWPYPVVFRRLAMYASGPSSRDVRVGTLHMRYEQLGYMQQVA